MKNKKQLIVWVEGEELQQFKIACATKRESMSKILRDFMRQYKASVNYNEYVNKVLDKSNG